MSIPKRLQAIQHFPVGGADDKRRYHFVAMRCGEMTAQGSGLGVRSFNFDLQGKWLWRFLRDRKSVWRKVIVAKFA